MKKVAGTIKLELAQYREMEAFAQFASDLDASTQKLLARGARLTELLKQRQYSPLSVAEQVVSIYAGTKGYLDSLELKDVRRFEEKLLEHARAENKDLLDELNATGAWNDEIDGKVKALLDGFARTFA